MTINAKCDLCGLPGLLTMIDLPGREKGTLQLAKSTADDSDHTVCVDQKRCERRQEAQRQIEVDSRYLKATEQEAEHEMEPPPKFTDREAFMAELLFSHDRYWKWLLAESRALATAFRDRRTIIGDRFPWESVDAS